MDIFVAGCDQVYSLLSPAVHLLYEGGGGYPVYDDVPLVANQIRYIKFDIKQNIARGLYQELYDNKGETTPNPDPNGWDDRYVGLSEVMFYGDLYCTLTEADGDTNGDCKVNLLDFATLVARWEECGWDGFGATACP